MILAEIGLWEGEAPAESRLGEGLGGSLALPCQAQEFQ